MANKTHLGIGAVIALLAAAYLGIDLQQGQIEQAAQPQDSALSRQNTAADASSAGQPPSRHQDDAVEIGAAFAQRQSNIQVQASGQVKAVLRDDNQGSRHQKFILKLRNGQTVLLAHNIDLSSRVENLQQGDTVEFYGEYEYSERGGVIHWTHHDPQRRHADGWLKHNGKIYQ